MPDLNPHRLDKHRKKGRTSVSTLPAATRPAPGTRRGRMPRRLVVLSAILLTIGIVAAGPAWADGSTSASTSITSTTPVAGSVPTTTGTGTTEPGTPAPGSTAVSGVHGTAVAPRGGTQLNGAGSSFAAPAIEAFTNNVSQAPYNLNVNYSSTSSGDGRYEFANQTTDFGVSDIAYGLGTTDTQAPSFAFNYIPVTAGGIALMYNIPGLNKTLQLSSYSACLLMTGGVSNWDSSVIARDNPGVSLPNLPVRPVTESDSAGTNFVLEEWCIDQQPAVWAAFANQQNSQSGGPGGGVAISANSPNSNWPALPNGFNEGSTSGVAGTVATSSGAIGAVQVKYASDLGFGPTTPAKGVASMLNASGKYTQPTPVDVASALAYATQLNNGTHKLDFNGIGPNVYNPSTYSYLLTRTTGWNPAKGAVLSAFVNYALTLGQQASPGFGYASLGLSLERYGVDAVLANVPGAVAVTAAEDAAYACGDLTPSEVAAGQTTPTCGVTNQHAPPPGASAGNNGSTVGTTSADGSSGSGSGADGSGGSGSSGSGANGSGGSGADPGVSLSGSGLAFTGGDPLPLVVLGAALIIGAWFVRRRLIRRGATEESP